MTELASHIVAFAVGAGAGAVFLTVLWRSLKELGKAPNASRQMIADAVLRHGIVYSLFYAALDLGGWSHLLGALIGFILIRSLAITYIGHSRVQRTGQEPI